VKKNNKRNVQFAYFQSSYSKELLFFGFYFIFFAFLILLGLNNKDLVWKNYDKKEEAGNEEKENIILDNYEFLWEIKFKEESNIDKLLLEGKRYHDIFLFYKYIDGLYEGEFYLEKDHLKIKLEEGLEDYEKELIKADFNNRWLDVNYIKEYIKEGDFIEKFERFDGTISKKYKIDDNFFITLSSKKDGIEEIIVDNILFDIFLQYKNVNKVIDFSI